MEEEALKQDFLKMSSNPKGEEEGKRPPILLSEQGAVS